jgi:hypothetical protein
MSNRTPSLLCLAGLAIAGALAPARAAELKDYPVRPVSWTAVRVTDGFWTPRLETNRLRTVWYDFEKCEETGRIDNFAKAGKLMEGPFKGTPFDDSDVFKVIEGAACTLATHPDPKLDRYLDDLIAKIAAAQEPDGYLYTARTIDPKCRLDFFGPTRWSNLRVSHELYNVGHLYEAAVAHFEATGKRTLLDVALRNAELVCRTFGPGPDQLKEPPGHQEIEIGLVRLYRATGERKYLDQAQFFCDLRGRADTHKLRGPYQQDHLPIVEQREAVGHAVRAGYFYCGVADVAALTGRNEWTRAVEGLWKNTVERKMHLTGGIGARAEGEAFGADYELPNASAYLETCAAIAHALWNHRMFLMHGDGCYFDVLERVIYNGFLSGVSLSGDRFFYPNPLENAGNYQRSPWFGCSCCPVNVVRFLPQVPGFAYATRDRQVFVNLFLGGTAKFEVAGTPLEIQQETHYPWDGKVLLRIMPQEPAEFRLSVRIPGWARNQPVPGDLYRYDDHLQPKVKLALNGKPVRLDLEQGYAHINRTWQRGDAVTLDLDLPVRRVAVHPEVKADRNRFAIERGPLVYCAEGADNGGKVLDTFLPGEITFAVAERPDLLGGVVTIKAKSRQNGTELTCIPYYAWCHRGANEMRVWHPVAPQTLPASHCWEHDTVEACFDGRLPKASNDHSLPRFTWWDHRGTLEWVRCDFESPRTVSAVEVYWFDDTGAGSCRVPKSWRLLYKDGDQWRPVQNRGDYGVRLDQFNVVEFDPVNTSSLRIEAQLQPGFSAGILEWRVR